QRRAMAEALRRVAGRLNRTYPIVIDGKEVESGDLHVRRDPSNLERVVGRVHFAGPEHVEAAVAAASRAFDAWANESPETRCQLLEGIADRMEARFFELAAWQVYECGKPWREATNDVCEAIDFCRYYALGARALFTPLGVDVPGEQNRWVYAPRGVTAVIAPWNFPLAILTGMTVAALVTGNTVIMKPAEQS